MVVLLHILGGERTGEEKNLANAGGRELLARVSQCLGLLEGLMGSERSRFS